MAEQGNKREIELLAPAGSYETFEAVIRAGADAVYLGGSQFGARAYADNLNEAEVRSAIDYAHIHGRKVYLTVNTLLKEEELAGRLYTYLLPYYEQGLDAVIVQDMGAFSLIRREFPGLDIHTSTQMTVTGREGAAYMKALGASRIVTARELALSEIRDIHAHVDVELESFVHGALCYCYSGQCLLSSMIGGRSGNRGRCAQPCRLPYEVFDAHKNRVQTRGNYILSPKDLCTISHIPAFAENGICSFKIEGRMKQAEYAAGVVSVYRSYIDGYLEDLKCAREAGKAENEARVYARERYRVSDSEQKKLLDLGNRSGFTDGYYFRWNGREMITFEKPNHARAKAAETAESAPREASLYATKEKIKGILILKKDFPATIEVSYGEHTVKQTGDVVQPALKQPLSREKVKACMEKTGNTPFSFAELVLEMEEDVFLPVQALNRLRREALMRIEESVLSGYRRTVPEEFVNSEEPEKPENSENPEKLECSQSLEEPEKTKAERPVSRNRDSRHTGTVFSVSIEQRSQRDAVLARDFVSDIYYDSSCYTRENIQTELPEDVAVAHGAGKRAYLILPAVFRQKTADFYREHLAEFLQAGLDGVVAKSYDAAAFAGRYPGVQFILDHSLYTWNREAKELLRALKPLRDTAPLELNRKELSHRDNHDSEMVIYGYLPLMTSAQCVHANTEKCDKHRTVMYLRDRYGNYFPVKNHCSECYNTIYNKVPLMLFSCRKELMRLGMAGYRLAFTVEEPGQVEKLLGLCGQTFLSGEKPLGEAYTGEYTNGHYKRGVE